MQRSEAAGKEIQQTWKWAAEKGDDGQRNEKKGKNRGCGTVEQRKRKVNQMENGVQSRDTEACEKMKGLGEIDKIDRHKE